MYKTSHPTRITGYIQRLCLVLTSALLLTACSSTKMTYGFLDWVAMWKIGGLVDLNAKQEKRTEAEIHALHEWHRTTQLPRYADYLEAVRPRLQAGDITAAQLHAETDKLQLMLDDIMKRAIPPATNIIASLSDEQVAGLLENIAEEREEYIEEHVEPDRQEQREKNIEELTDHLNRFLGNLTNQQERWVEAWSKAILPYAELSAKQQRLWQEHLAKYLALRDNQQLLQEGLRQLILYRSDNWHQEFQKVIDINQTLTYELLAKIFNSLTPEQKNHLDKRLQEYISDFRELARGE